MVVAISLPVAFERPEWLWLLLAIPVIVGVSMRSLAGLDRWRRIAAIALRSLVIALLAVALARIEWVRRNDHVAVLFVLDRSLSIPEELQQSAREYIKQVARTAHRDDRLGVISFDGQADVDLIPSRGGVDLFNFGQPVEPDRSNLAAGLRLAMAAFPEGFARRVVLLTDGNENAGDLLEEIEAARSNKVVVDVVPLEYHYEHEMLLDRLIVPARAQRGTRVPLRIVAKSRQPAQARLTLYHNDVEVPLADPILNLSGGMRPEPFNIPIEITTGAVQRFDARITPVHEAADSIAENNRATGFTFVEGEGGVLILNRPGSPDENALLEALRREQVDVELAGATERQIDPLALQEYSTIILSNVSADQFNEQQHLALASYVKDFGGGLIMIGGDDGFGAGGWIGTPLEEVSPVEFEVKHKKAIPLGALVIVMHSCEIPRGNYWGEQVAIAAVRTISSMDYLGVICYSWTVGGPNWDVPLAPATDKEAVIRSIKQMQIGDMPDFDSTMRIAVREMMALPDAVSQRHIIIISDGDPSPPTPATIRMLTDNQITCSTVGIGYGSHVIEQPLRDIASRTGGRFYPVRNPRQLPQIFVKEAKVVKRPLLDERTFQPHLINPFAETVTGLAGHLPPLHGLVLTTPRPDSIMPVARRTTDGDDPVLAHWNYEMGKMVAFTSGWWPKWGSDWAAWEQFGKFWAQVVRWSMRRSGSGDFDVVTRLEGNKGRVIVEALNKDASYLNFLRIRGLVTTPSMQRRELELAPTGPGQYEGTFDLDEYGNYLVTMQYTDPDHESGLLNTGLSLPASPEFRELEANVGLLERAAELSGGRVLAMDPRADDVFSRNLPPSVSRQPVWRWVVQWLLLPLFLLDVAARRLASTLALSIYVEVAVFVVALAVLASARAPVWMYPGALILAEVVGWSIRWRWLRPAIQFLTLSGLRSAQSEKSLSQLKGVREKVREELAAQPAGAPAPTGAETRPPDAAIPLEPAADPRARFDVGDTAAARPAGDLVDALDGAKADQPAGTGAGPRPRPGQQGAQGDMASRLLKAKRRAQEQIKEQSENDK